MLEKLVTPELVKSVFKDMELKLVHAEGTYEVGTEYTTDTVQSILTYKGEVILESNTITVKVPL